jgi:hypothetical protein
MSQPPKGDSNALVPLAAENLSLKLPDPPKILTQEDAARTRNAITKHGAVTQDAKVVYERDALPAIFATDAAGANKFVSERTDDELLEDGNKVYVRTPAIKEELERRITQPRDAYQLERLRDAERCLDAVRDTPELENRRLKLEARNRKEMPKLKHDVRKNADTCISGEPLRDDAEVHHVERVADNPDLALTRTNLLPVNPSVHDKIHAAQAHTPRALEELAKREGWPLPLQRDHE